MEEKQKCKYSNDGLCTFFEDSDLKCNGEEEKDECACHIGAYSLDEL